MRFRRSSPTPPKAASISEHGAIGNLRTVALVSTAGTIDYLCHPHLDSPSVFCALLDPEAGGSFSIRPVEGEATWTSRQIYIPDTNVLVTRFMNHDAVVELTDYMPILIEDGPRSAVIRRVACIRGTVAMTLRCEPRFDYGRDGRPETRLDGDGVVFTAHSEIVSGHAGQRWSAGRRAGRRANSRPRSPAAGASARALGGAAQMTNSQGRRRLHRDDGGRSNRRQAGGAFRHPIDEKR